MRRLMVDRVDNLLANQFMVLDSSGGSGLMPFRPKEFSGWAIPVVGQQ
jgi:hypothetical protein